MVTVTSHFPLTAGADDEEALDLVARLSRARPFSTFDTRVVEYLGAVGRHLMRDPSSRAHPQVVSLGYWLRPAALERLQNDAVSRFVRPGELRSPRGLAFHLPPANVDTMFVYSWALSLLCGNTNIVRLPSTLSTITTHLIDILRDFSNDEIRAANLFLSYPRNDILTARISQFCDVRIVWGGDEKVVALRAIPLPAHAIDVNFGHRFSMAAIKAETYAALDDESARALARQVYNDIFWFDQMACASPRIVFWCGMEGFGDELQQRFYTLLADAAKERGYAADLGAAVAKTNLAYRAILDHELSRYERVRGVVDVLAMPHPADVRHETIGGGLLWHVELSSLDDLAPTLTRADQTLSYFGFNRGELESLVRRSNGCGIDRVVPIGRALEFSPLWDGHDLIATLTRVTHII